MSNKVENKEIVANEVIYYDPTNMKGEMMRYRNNSLPYKLGMIAICCSILGAFICLNSYVWNLTVIVKILGNICILLFGFLSIEKVKAYSLEYSYILIGVGAVCVARIFWIPLQLIIWYNKYIQSGGTDLEAQDKLGPAVIGEPKLNSYLPQSGVFRGVASMVLIGIAAALFIAAGVIGVIKAKQYHEYMSHQDTTKGV